MKNKYDIAAIGECLIDCVPSGKNELGINLFGANPGGAPANVLAMFSKLGGNTAFIGKVGKDSFGELLRQNLKNANIDDTGLISDEKYNTTLAFVHLNDKGDRSFSFYRKNCADVMLKYEEIPNGILENTRFFHFGSVSLTDEPSRTATLKSAEKAKQSGCIITYDPNYRPLLWENIGAAKEEMLKGALLADIVKVSDEEMTILTDETDFFRGSQKLLTMGANLVFVTLGEKGAFYCNKTANGLLRAFDVQTVDTTGAGDAFFGAVLWKLKDKTKEQISNLSDSELKEIVLFGNAAGSLTTTKKGAIPAMPNYNSVCELIDKGVLP